MNLDRLNTAIEEAKRFLGTASEAKKQARVVGDHTFIDGGRASGACKRASMDLTRALADLRKSS